MLSVSPIPAFADNYIWMIRGASQAAGHQHLVAVVDPGDASPVISMLESEGLTLAAILITHHHPDHVGGVSDLVERYSPTVFGPATERIPGNPTPLREGDRVMLPQMGLRFEVLDVPGHTAGHIAYVGHGAAFCGDTLFSAGCGRLFEGTAAQMHTSLAKLAALPTNTSVYCTHEYTLANLKFAAAVEPENRDLQSYVARCIDLRAKGQPTLPSNIGLEHTMNPFLRASCESVKRAAEAHTGRTLQNTIEVFAALRAWKDDFKAA